MNRPLLLTAVLTTAAALTVNAVLAADPKADAKKAPAPAAATEKKADVAKAPAADAAKAAPAAAQDPKDVRDKLVKLNTPEQAFKQVDLTRKQIAALVLQLNEKLKKATTDDEKKKTQADLDDTSKKFQTLCIAMDVCFGVSAPRVYEYDEVTSTVYAKVGTVEDAFTRTIRARDALRKQAQELTAQKEAEKDAAKQAEIQKKLDTASRQYQLVAASLQVVFNVSPERDYYYDAKNTTLYLKVSEHEVEKIKADIAKIQEDAKKKADEAKKDAPKPAEPKK